MLEKLQGFLDSGLEDDPFVALTALHFEECDMLIEAAVLLMDGAPQPVARWQIRAREVRDHFVGPEGGLFEVLDSDHVLVRQHTAPREELYFHGRPRCPSTLAGRLWMAHETTVRDWIPFHRFLNRSIPLEPLLDGGFGRLADGPSFLIRAYAAVLEADGVRPSSPPASPPMWWNGEKHVEDPQGLVGLLIDDYYFVARGFEEQRLDSTED